MKIYVVGEDGKMDGRFTVNREWCGYERQRWVMRFASSYRGSCERLSDAWYELLRWYCQYMDRRMLDLAMRRLTQDAEVAARLREEMGEWPDQELANVAAGLCSYQTAYGMPHIEYCDYPVLDQTTLYCAHHLRDLREDYRAAAGAIGMPGWITTFE